MDFNNKKDRRATTIAVIIIGGLIPFALLLFFHYFNTELFDPNASIGNTWDKFSGQIIIITIMLYGITSFYVGKSFLVKKPKETKTLAEMEWATEDYLKENFKTAPIDPFADIPIGGIPIKKLNESELLYDIDVNQDLTIGATRSGKTRKILLVLIFLCAMAGESILANDPKKELYKMTKKYLQKRGYKVFCLDFRFLEYSDCKNPMDRIINFLNENEIDEADQAAQDLVESLVEDNGQTEPIWIDGQKAMAKATALAVAQANVDIKKKNLFSIYQTLGERGEERSFNGDPKFKKMELTAYMEYLEESNIARTAYLPIRNAPEKTRGSFMTSTLSTLRLFGSRKLNKVVGKSDFQFKDFVDQKIALFIVNPDEKTTYDKIASIMYDQSYQEFVEQANKNGGKIKKRIHNIFDEAGNMAIVKDLDKKLTVSLGRGILYHLFIQSYAQLDKLYKPEGKKTIVDNCITKFFISSGDFDTCEDISKRVGEKTIWVEGTHGNISDYGNTNGGSIQYSQQKKRLIDPNVLLTSDFRNGDGIILTKTYNKPAQVFLPDISEYEPFNKELEDPKTFVEEKRKDRELLYAIPRWIVITQQELMGLPSQDFSLNGFSARGLGLQHSKNNSSPNLNEMYWYWSMRDDIGEEIKNHLLKIIDSSNHTMERKDIKEYLNSKEFLEFLNSVDVVEVNQNDKDIIKKDESSTKNESTELEELMGDYE